MNEKQVDLLTDEHLEWLVASRSRNQKAALELHLLINAFSDVIGQNNQYRTVVHHLISINFSLWRAVFLSDLQEGSQHILRDARNFLKKLVANNAIAYPQDRESREWTFVYYMENADSRLGELSNKAPSILPEEEFINTENAGDKLWWDECQISSENAFNNLKKILLKQQ